MNFSESVAYLYSLGNEVSAMKLGLETTEKLLFALGNPEKKILKIQIAGTNGKGSTCAFLDAICRQANIKTGLFTSPHLISITERIKINGEELSEEDFARHATKIREIAESLVNEKELETVPTFFEQITAIAVSAFAEAQIELAILETGLGGRLDSVTATRAQIAAITPIDYDHQQILGETLAEIAAEKAAIIREDMKVIIAAEQSFEAMKVIAQKCESVNVKPQYSNYRTKIYTDSSLTAHLTVEFEDEEIYSNIRLGLNGRHQFVNARLAIGLAEILRRDFNLKIEKSDVEIGLKTARHQGRLEFYEGFLFDGAHNIAGARALKEYLDEFIRTPITMIFGAMRDKDLTEIAETLFPLAAELIFTTPNNQRSLKADELMKFLPENFDVAKVYKTDLVEKALEIAKQIETADNLILVTGSLYLVGEAQKLLKKNAEQK